jgi:hypothetical protein
MECQICEKIWQKCHVTQQTMQLLLYSRGSVANSSVGLSCSGVGSNVSASDPSRFLERNVRRNDTHRTEIMYQKLLRAIPNIQPGSIFDVGSPSAEQNQI